jgi:hypothetical protein
VLLITRLRLGRPTFVLVIKCTTLLTCIENSYFQTPKSYLMQQWAFIYIFLVSDGVTTTQRLVIYRKMFFHRYELNMHEGNYFIHIPEQTFMMRFL